MLLLLIRRQHAVLVTDRRNDEAVEDVEGRIALPRACVESSCGHDNKIEIRNDDNALTPEADRGNPGHFLVFGKRATKPPLVAIEEQAAKIADRLKAWRN